MPVIPNPANSNASSDASSNGGGESDGGKQKSVRGAEGMASQAVLCLHAGTAPTTHLFSPRSREYMPWVSDDELKPKHGNK